MVVKNSSKFKVEQLYIRNAFKDFPELANEFLRAMELSNDGLVTGSANLSNYYVLTPNPQTKKKPFSYQKEIINNVIKHYNLKESASLMISLPTGAGKTRTAVWIIEKLITDYGVKRFLWLAPTIELVSQSVETFLNDWNVSDIETRILVNNFLSKASVKNPIICISSFQYAMKNELRSQLFSPEIIIIDEAHQASASAYSDFLKNHSLKSNSYLLGLTATPGRTNEKDQASLAAIFGNNLLVPKILGSNPIEFLRKIGVYSNIEWHKINLQGDSAHLIVRSRSSRSLKIDELNSNSKRFWATIDTIKENADSQLLVFASSIAHCHALEVALRSRGVLSEIVSYKTDSSTRSELISKFKRGVIKVLMNVAILNTGFDYPKLEQVLIATPIRSSIIWEQIIGRIARGKSVGGTEVAKVFEIDDHQAMHGDLMSYSRYFGNSWN